jgi:hypothetical protein
VERGVTADEGRSQKVGRGVTADEGREEASQEVIGEPTSEDGRGHRQYCTVDREVINS